MQTAGGWIVKVWSDRWTNRSRQSQIQMAGTAKRGILKGKHPNNYCGLAGNWDVRSDDSLSEQLMGISASVKLRKLIEAYTHTPTWTQAGVLAHLVKLRDVNTHACIPGCMDRDMCSHKSRCSRKYSTTIMYCCWLIKKHWKWLSTHSLVTSPQFRASFSSKQPLIFLSRVGRTLNFKPAR